MKSLRLKKPSDIVLLSRRADKTNIPAGNAYSPPKGHMNQALSDPKKAMAMPVQKHAHATVSFLTNMLMRPFSLNIGLSKFLTTVLQDVLSFTFL